MSSARLKLHQDLERGSALIWALIFVVVTSGMVISHTAYMAANRREMDVRLRQTTLAASFARSGLTDALAWFQRQPNQPVTAFAPLYDPSGDPPYLDTMDPALGLVREFEVRGELWGRYEVRNSEAQDISSQRALTAAGSVWEMGARGILFDRRDPAKSFDQPPNHVVAVTALRTEIRGIPLVAPAPAAVCIDDYTKIDVRPNGRVQGLGKGGFAFTDPGFMAALLGDITGAPAVLPVIGYDATPTKVFSMSLDDLRSLSDYVIEAGQPMPANIQPYRVVFVNGDLVLSTALIGRMLLVVNGDLTALPNNNSRVTGMIYVTGNATIDGPFKFKGTMVVRGMLKVGVFAQLAELTYDGLLVDRLRRELARYRLSKSFLPW